MAIMGCRKVLHGIWVVLLKMQIVLLVCAFLVTLSCMLLEVIFRYILEIEIYGLEELASAVCIWVYFLGAAYATYEGTHLKADLAHLFIRTSQSEAIWKAVISIITLGLACYVMTWSYDYLIWGFTMGEYLRIGGAVGSFPSVYSHGGIFVGFILIVLYFTVESIRRLRTVFQK